MAIRNLKPADKNGGESSRPIFIPSQVEPQIRHKMANKKEGKRLCFFIEEEFIRLDLYERYCGRILNGLKAKRFKNQKSGSPTLPSKWGVSLKFLLSEDVIVLTKFPLVDDNIHEERKN